MLEFDEVGTSVPPQSLQSRMSSSASDYYCMTFDEPEEMDDVTLSSSATSKARKCLLKLESKQIYDMTLNIET